MTRILDVYLCNNLAGKLEQEKDGELIFTYNSDYLKSALYGISISLPLRSDPYKSSEVKNFFSGLLPEESVRNRLASYLGLSEKNSFGLLEVIGGDCAGALALYTQGKEPTKEFYEAEILDEAKLKEILELIKRRPMLAGDDGYRLSLAGAQDKLAVGFKNGKVELIKGGTPTTHIIKPLIDRVQDSAHNELFCMKLAEMIGLNVPRSSLEFVNNTPFYIVERYDRYFDNDGNVQRIHQEDFCQALGVPPEMKYEREGGPGIEDCKELIRKYSLRPAFDQIKLLNIIIFNYLIGNADAHAKNFSLLYKENKPELAPAYDLLCTSIYPNLSDKMAMKIGGKYKPREIYLHNFYKHIAETKTAQAGFNKQAKNITSKIIDSSIKLKSDLKKSDINSEIYDEIIGVIKDRTERLSIES